MIEIIPAVMPDSFEDLRDKVSFVASHTKTVQIDIMDGKFVKSRTWPYFSSDKHTFDDLLTESDGMPYWDKVDYEVDLMIKNPEIEMENWIVAGAARVVVHVESTEKIPEIIKIIDNRAELGLALNIDTPTEKILPYLEDIQFVQFMGIATIGLQGEALDERVIDKIHAFHNAHPEVVISVDGGVSFENAKMLIEIGVKRLVSGSVIFNTTNIPDTLENFKKLVNG